MVKVKSSVPIKNRPDISAERCVWRAPKEIRENEGLATLGLLQEKLNENIIGCLIDLSEVEWADPLPLLNLTLVLAESNLTKDRIIIDLGSIQEADSTERHRIFLKFLAQQGFVAAIEAFGTLYLEGTLYTSPGEVLDLRLHLAAIPELTHFLNADCILARAILTNGFQQDRSVLQETVEAFVREAQTRAIEDAFGKDPLARDMLFQTLRKLLYELLLNVAEHSHPDNSPAYAGVYARLRGAKPVVETDAQLWSDSFQQGLKIYGQSHFNPNPYAEWFELFVTDIGVGLTTNILQWREPEDDSDVAQDLKKAKRSKNPLQAIAHRLFRCPLSRYPRHDSTRTAVTGLQHLGHLLSIGGDYCRIYTQRGSWVGGAVPWTKSSYSHKDIRNPKSSPDYVGLIPISGTAYAFSIQPCHRNLSEAISGIWLDLDKQGREEVLHTLRTRTLFDPQISVDFYDRRTTSSSNIQSIEDLPEDAPEVAVLRPPRLTSKQDIAQWLSIIAGTPHSPPSHPVKKFVIADLTPFQALAFREILLNVKININSQIDIFLVSDQWTTCCLCTQNGNGRLSDDSTKAREFMRQPSPDNERRFWIGTLAILLRQMDSELFWEDTEDQRRAFFDGTVVWSESKDDPITLRRYLDFPHALADPRRYRACRRGLRRCLALFQDYKVCIADDLVASLVKDALGSMTKHNISREAATVVVGSVAITGETAHRFLTELGGGAIVHVMINQDAVGGVRCEDLSAILWVSQLPHSEDFSSSSRPSPRGTWKRIPNTPFISPLGEQSISLLRYKRGKEGELIFESSFYGRTPEETYDDFRRLRVLKIGHWTYGNHHDLLTINTMLAFRYSLLELGPLYHWLREQFEFFFYNDAGHPSRAQLLIYPSHPVTDSIIDRLKQDPNFSAILPKGGMVPVKFLGVHTVSPLLTSHLLAYEIEQHVTQDGWNSWSAVIFDDGAVSGKHLRELTQLLHGIKAKNVYTLALIDRTGLPAQEDALEEYLTTHKRFWRWDVPPLGPSTNCPLCHALEVVQAYAHDLSSSRQRKRLGEWVRLWGAQDVDTSWHDGGLTSSAITPPLKITFGVDQKYDGSRLEKNLRLNDSTSAASLLLELTRLTTRADTIIKKANILVERGQIDGAIEIITSQLLLFSDELSTEQKYKRLLLLLRFIWNRSFVTPAMALAGLSISLAENQVITKLWATCTQELLAHERLGNLDAVLSVNIIRSRISFINGNQYSLQDNANDIEQHNYIMLGGGGGHRAVVRSFLALYRNPTNKNTLSAHTSEVRSRLNKISALAADTNYADAVAGANAVLKDMRLIEEVLDKVRREFIATIPDSDISPLTDAANNLQDLILNRRDTAQDRAKFVKALVTTSNSLGKLLYGDGSGRKSGLITRIGTQFFRQFNNDSEFDRNLIGGIVRETRNDWKNTISAKATNERNREPVSRWTSPNGVDPRKPIILYSKISRTNKIWIYCDTFIQHIIHEVMANVFHAMGSIGNPWADKATQVGGTVTKAHLWWRLDVDENYAIITMANASANKAIVLNQTLNIAGLERAGGKIVVKLKEHQEWGLLAYAYIYIPRHSYFLKDEA